VRPVSSAIQLPISGRRFKSRAVCDFCLSFAVFAQPGIAKSAFQRSAFALVLPDFTYFSHHLSYRFASLKVFGEASHRYVLRPDDNVHAVPPYSMSETRGAAYAAAYAALLFPPAFSVFQSLPGARVAWALRGLCDHGCTYKWRDM
jgi:hypothetical protein